MASHKPSCRSNGEETSMPETVAPQTAAFPPLTALAEEERMFQAAAREFAENEIGPHVTAMDGEGVFRHDLIEKFFAQGFMAIEVPERLGGSGGSFLMCMLAIDEVSSEGACAVGVVGG